MEGVLGKNLVLPERQGTIIVGDMQGEERYCHKSLCPCECSQATGHRLQEVWGQVQAPASIVSSRGMWLLGDLRAGTELCICGPESA